jgi:hypothetical protein
MLHIRKAWVSWALFCSQSPNFQKVSNIAIASTLAILAIHIYQATDGTQLVNISGVRVPVECKGFCLDKD